MAENMARFPRKQATVEEIRQQWRSLQATMHDDPKLVSSRPRLFRFLYCQLTHLEVLEYLGKKGYTNTEASLRQEADAHERLASQPMMVGGAKYERAYGRTAPSPSKYADTQKHCLRATSTTISRSIGRSSDDYCGQCLSIALSALLLATTPGTARLSRPDSVRDSSESTKTNSASWP
jgi:hypothetical protein